MPPRAAEGRSRGRGRASSSAPPVSARLSRYYHEPIGPPSELIHLSNPDQGTTGWVEQAQETLDRLERELDSITGTEVEEDLGRCDVSDLKGQVTKWYDNTYYREEFKKWFEARLFGPSIQSLPWKQGSKQKSPTIEMGDGQQLVGNGNEGEGEDSRPAKKKKVATKASKGKGKAVDQDASQDGDENEGDGEDEDEEDGIVLDKEVKKLIDDAQDLPLSILKPWDADYFIRRTKVADVNCLPEIRPNIVPELDSSPGDPEAVDPLANVLLTITLYPIPRIVRKIHTNPQRQVIVCLASNTLGELRDNITAGGDGIPRRANPSELEEDEDDDEENEGTDGSDEERGTREGQYGIGELDEMGTIESATRKRISGTFGDRQQGNGNSKEKKKFDQYGNEIIEWAEEYRVSGACFGIEGIFYPDVKGGEKTDYAKMLLDTIENTQWSYKSGKKKVERRGGRRGRGQNAGSDSDEEDGEDDDDDSGSASSIASPVNPRSNDISVHSTPAPPEFVDVENIDPTLRDGYTGDQDVNMVDGSAVQVEEEAKGGLYRNDPNKPKFVAGTPMHDTKIGHIPFRIGQPYWFVHQGNHEHVWSIDSIRLRHPSDPPLASSTSNDPYPLTTLLSRQTLSKCSVCDRDAGSIFLINDFSASESPSLVCTTCFDLLHPELPSKRDLAREKRREERREEKVRKQEEKRKAIRRQQRRLKRQLAPKDDDSVGSGGEAEEIPVLPELPVEDEAEESENETSDEEIEGRKERRKRMFMEGVQIVRTVIEK